MKFVAALGFAAAASAAPKVARDSCSSDYSGKFAITFASPAKRDLIQKRSCSGDDLVMTLSGGKLTDSKGRTGYVASNYQFQFDGPVQAGALYDDDFAICDNMLAFKGTKTTWSECLSGDFYNLYDRSWAKQCKDVELMVLPCGDSDSGSVTQIPDGQVVGSSMIATTVITEISDGQPQVHTTTVAMPLCQIGDGQVQGQTTPCAQLPAITQISDGQIQAPTSVPAITQIGDGQVQAPTGVVSQISDGQVQVPTSAPTTAPVVSQISDGQVQVPTSSAGPVVSQISDGQVQVPTSSAMPPSNSTIATVPTPTPVPSSLANKDFVGTSMISLFFAALAAALYL